MIDLVEIETVPRKQSYKFAYTVLVLGAVIIASHYLVVPHLFNYFGV